MVDPPLTQAAITSTETMPGAAACKQHPAVACTETGVDRQSVKLPAVSKLICPDFAHLRVPKYEKEMLRELNNLNWERFKVAMDARFAQAEARWTERLAQSETRLIEKLFDTTLELTAMKADLMKWTFIYWCGLAIPLIGLILYRK